MEGIDFIKAAIDKEVNSFNKGTEFTTHKIVEKIYENHKSDWDKAVLSYSKNGNQPNNKGLNITIQQVGSYLGRNQGNLKINKVNGNKKIPSSANLGGRKIGRKSTLWRKL
jgi:hypothetical protein